MRDHARRPALLAALLVLPAVLFVAANLLKYGLGVAFLSDALGPFAEPGRGFADAVVTGLVLLGPVAALAIAFPPLVRFRFGRSVGMIQASMVLRLRWPQLAVAVAALAVLAALGGYVVAENAACWFGSAAAC